MPDQKDRPSYDELYRHCQEMAAMLNRQQQLLQRFQPNPMRGFSAMLWQLIYILWGAMVAVSLFKIWRGIL